MYTFSRFGVDFKVVAQEDPALQSFYSQIFNGWENDTYQQILPHLSTDKTFLDIGAWQGPISLVAQQYSKQCICFEPDPIAYQYLLKNIEVNQLTNIIPVELAVSSEVELHIGNHELGGSGTSYLRPQNAVKCETISFSEILRRYDLNENNISVIKIDVEGYEYELLQDPILKEINVPKHISTHGEFFEDKQAYDRIIRQFFGSDVSYSLGGLDSIFIDKRP